MTSSGLFYSPTATMQNSLPFTATNGFKLVNGLRVPSPLINSLQKQQDDALEFDFADYPSPFHSPTDKLLRCRTATGYHVPMKIRRHNTAPLPFKEENNLFHLPTAVLVSDVASLKAPARYVGGLRIPPRLCAISEPHPQSQSRLSVNDPTISSPTAGLLQDPEGDSQPRTNNGFGIPHSISRRRKTSSFITSTHHVETRVWNTRIEASEVFQKHSFKAMSSLINYRTHHSYQSARAAHVLHADLNNVKDDGYRAEAKQTQLCTCVDMAISQLHDPFIEEDRQVLRRILGYLDQRRHDLVARCISVDSNAPQVKVPASWLEVADIAFEGIHTVDYPYLLRVMQAIDILACGAWCADPEQ
ncbi:hypothetical protein LX36DRAFT_722119 [Colletotrichum falcatum]|nr:hypothetical protein LX36DRAFT_722119 [Colletotrichum falcatum]